MLRELRIYQIVYIAIMSIAIIGLSTFDSLSSGTNSFIADDEQTFYLMLAGITIIGIIFFEFVQNSTKIHFIAFHVGTIIGVLSGSFGVAYMFGGLLILSTLSIHFLIKKIMEWKNEIVH